MGLSALRLRDRHTSEKCPKALRKKSPNQMMGFCNRLRLKNPEALREVLRGSSSQCERRLDRRLVPMLGCTCRYSSDPTKDLKTESPLERSQEANFTLTGA